MHVWRYEPAECRSNRMMDSPLPAIPHAHYALRTLVERPPHAMAKAATGIAALCRFRNAASAAPAALPPPVAVARELSVSALRDGVVPLDPVDTVGGLAGRRGRPTTTQAARSGGRRNVRRRPGGPARPSMLRAGKHSAFIDAPRGVRVTERHRGGARAFRACVPPPPIGAHA